MRAFVISDIHGCLKEFQELLTHWNKNDKLLILGDLMDRGEDSFGVMREIFKIKKEFPGKLVYVGGNHDDMFLDAIYNPREKMSIFLKNGGDKTILSFLERGPINQLDTLYENDSEIDKFLQEVENGEFDDEIGFLETALNYCEWGKFILVHAGLNFNLKDWHYTSKRDFREMRDMHKRVNTTGKKIMFGHTPVDWLNADKSLDIYQNPYGGYYCIDGGCVFGGLLHGVVINKEGEILEIHSVEKRKINRLK